MKRSPWMLLVTLALGGACLSPEPTPVAEAPRAAPATVVATEHLTATAVTPVSEPVPFDRGAVAPANLRALAVVAVGPDHPTAEAPDMPRWIPEHVATQCTAAPNATFTCPAGLARTYCNAIADLPAGCRAMRARGIAPSRTSVPVCCP